MQINYWAVIVSAIASMVIGSIWYGPLFGKTYMRAIGMDQWSKERQEEEKKKMGITYLVQFIASMVMFYALARFMYASGDLDISGGVNVALWAWVGFVVPVKLGDAIWGGKMVMFWLGAGNMLLTLLAAGVILGAWQ